MSRLDYASHIWGQCRYSHLCHSCSLFHLHCNSAWPSILARGRNIFADSINVLLASLSCYTQNPNNQTMSDFAKWGLKLTVTTRASRRFCLFLASIRYWDHSRPSQYLVKYPSLRINVLLTQCRKGKDLTFWAMFLWDDWWIGFWDVMAELLHGWHQ